MVYGSTGASGPTRVGCAGARAARRGFPAVRRRSSRPGGSTKRSQHAALYVTVASAAVESDDKGDHEKSNGTRTAAAAEKKFL